MSWLKTCFPHHKRTYIQVVTSVQAVSETIQLFKICETASTVHLKSALHQYLAKTICYSAQLTRSPDHLPDMFLCHSEVNPPVSHFRLTLSFSLSHHGCTLALSIFFDPCSAEHLPQTHKRSSFNMLNGLVSSPRTENNFSNLFWQSPNTAGISPIVLSFTGYFW